MIIKKVQKISIYLIYLHPVPISGFPLAPAKDTQQLPGVRSPKDTWCLVVQAHEVTGSRFHKARAHQEMACWSDSSRPRHKRPETEVPWISLKDGENMTYSPHKTSACLMGRNMDCEHTHTPLKWQKLQQGLSIRRAQSKSQPCSTILLPQFSLSKRVCCKSCHTKTYESYDRKGSHPLDTPHGCFLWTHQQPKALPGIPWRVGERRRTSLSTSRWTAWYGKQSARWSCIMLPPWKIKQLLSLKL